MEEAVRRYVVLNRLDKCMILDIMGCFIVCAWVKGDVFSVSVTHPMNLVQIICAGYFK